MNEQELREQIERKRLDRTKLSEWLERTDLGVILRQDLVYAVEEIDELLAEYERTFPKR